MWTLQPSLKSDRPRSFEVGTRGVRDCPTQSYQKDRAVPMRTCRGAQSGTFVRPAEVFADLSPYSGGGSAKTIDSACMGTTPSPDGRALQERTAFSRSTRPEDEE